MQNNMKSKNNQGADMPSKNNGDRVYRKKPSISALEELLTQIPKENQVLVKEVVGEIRGIVVNAVKAGGVIFISDIAKRVKGLDLRPDEHALKEFIELAAAEELRESGVDLKAAIIHRTLGSVSRYYLEYGMVEEAAKDARRAWSIALDKLHKHFAGEPVEKDDFDLPEDAAA